MQNEDLDQTGFSTLLRDSLLMESGGGEKEAEGRQWLQGSVVRVHHSRYGTLLDHSGWERRRAGVTALLWR